MRHGPVSYAPVRYAPVRRYKPPEGSPPFSEASSRAKRGRPAERSEAVPPSKARLHRGRRRAKRGRAKVIGRSPLQKNSKRFHQKAQGNHLFILKFSLLPGLFNKNIIFKKSIFSILQIWQIKILTTEFRVPEFRSSEFGVAELVRRNSELRNSELRNLLPGTGGTCCH